MAGLFEAFAFGIKETRALEAHAPWADDPYDVLTSFAIFFVPLVAMIVAIRVPFCRRSEPLPLSGVRDLLRSVQVLIGLVLIVLASDWASVALGGNRASWSPVTPLLIAALSVASVLWVVVAAWGLVAGRALPRLNHAEPVRRDCLADALLLAELASRRFGPASPFVARGIKAVDRSVATRIRRRPALSAALVASAFSAMISGTAAIEEGPSQILPLFFVIGWCGMFAFLAIGGSYLGIVRPAHPVAGVKRRLLDALVAACASVPVAVGLRDSLWLVAGMSADRAGVLNLASLLILVAVLTFASTLVVETRTRRHEPAASRGG